MNKILAAVAAGVAIGGTGPANQIDYRSRLAYRCNRGDLPACAEHDFNCPFSSQVGAGHLRRRL